MIELPHVKRPFYVNNTLVYADNAYDAAATRAQNPARVKGGWQGHIRKGADLVPYGPIFRVVETR